MKILASLGLFVFLTTLSFPLSADAFGRRPSGSEVYQTQPVPTNNLGNDRNGKPPHAVPEPSSILFLGIGVSLVALVSIRKWLRRTDQK